MRRGAGIDILEDTPVPKLPVFYVVPRRRVVAVLVVVAVLAGAYLLSDRLVLSYRPLQQGNVSRTFQQVRQIDAPGYKGASVFDFRAGETFRYGFTLRNTGSRSVRVTELPEVPGRAVLRRVGVELAGPKDESLAGPFRPFRPFTLDPGEQRGIRLTWRFPSCDHSEPGATMSWDRQPITYEVWGVARQVDFELPTNLVVASSRGTC